MSSGASANDPKARLVQTVKQQVREFLSQTFQQYELKDSEDIFASGFVTSLFVMQLVLFVEQEFSITVEDEDLEMDNFRTVNAIAEFAARKSAAVVAK